MLAALQTCELQGIGLVNNVLLRLLSSFKLLFLTFTLGLVSQLARGSLRCCLTLASLNTSTYVTLLE